MTDFLVAATIGLALAGVIIVIVIGEYYDQWHDD